MTSAEIWCALEETPGETHQNTDPVAVRNEGNDSPKRWSALDLEPAEQPRWLADSRLPRAAARRAPDPTQTSAWGCHCPHCGRRQGRRSGESPPASPQGAHHTQRKSSSPLAFASCSAIRRRRHALGSSTLCPAKKCGMKSPRGRVHLGLAGVFERLFQVASGEHLRPARHRWCFCSGPVATENRHFLLISSQRRGSRKQWVRARTDERHPDPPDSQFGVVHFRWPNASAY